MLVPQIRYDHEIALVLSLVDQRPESLIRTGCGNRLLIGQVERPRVAHVDRGENSPVGKGKSVGLLVGIEREDEAVGGAAHA